MSDALKEAMERANNLPSRPTNEVLLRLYGLYKQATVGDANPDDRPGGFDFKAIAKFDAWLDCKGLSKEEAENAYIDKVNEISA